MRVVTTLFHGNPNVGLCGYCAAAGGKDLLLLGPRLNEDEHDELQDALQVELHHVTVAGTPLPGLFLAGNSHALLVPVIAFPKEVEQLERLKLPVKIFKGKLTCLGNNIVANDHGCIVNPGFSDADIEDLQDMLKVPVKRAMIAGVDTPGACLVLNGKNGIIHRDAAEHEIELVKQTLGLDSLEPASVSLGSPYIKAGILSNAHGFVISSLSGGPEIVHVEQSLGYLEER